jgi:hypothetical protein
MAIPLFVGDVRRTDSDTDTTVQTFGYQITEELYWVVGNADQLPLVIKQSTEVNSCDHLHLQLAFNEVCHVRS